jgi:hypothetical protein
MPSRFVTIFILLSAMPALANELKPEEARRFLVGKWWSYHCSEGTTGFGRISANGSVSGVIKQSGSAAIWHDYPSQTLSFRSDSICASVPVGSSLLHPCFSFNKTDERSFRGSVSSPWWMWVLWGSRYCDFIARASPDEGS